MSLGVHSVSKGLPRMVTCGRAEHGFWGPCRAWDCTSSASGRLGRPTWVSLPCIHGEHIKLSLQGWAPTMLRVPRSAWNPASSGSRGPGPPAIALGVSRATRTFPGSPASFYFCCPSLPLPPTKKDLGPPSLQLAAALDGLGWERMVRG